MSDKQIDFTVRLEDWSTGYAMQQDPFRAPETGPVCLRGQIHGHPRYKPGTRVFTPRIVEANGTRIIVEGGYGDDKERYEVILGEIDPAFREWLLEHRPNWDPENPITMRSQEPLLQGSQASGAAGKRIS
jgi:hypothetical protein